MDTSLEKKLCSRSDCIEENPQPIKNFGVRKGGAKPKSECKTCCAAYMAKRYREDSEAARRRTREWTARNPGKRHPYTKFKKNECETCGFRAIDLCQLDVDHIDGNKHNNDPSNLQTLCANCHRIKTKLNKDNQRRYGLILVGASNGPS